MSKPSVAVAIPAYNEADGIADFLREINRALSPHVGALRIVVVDDHSTDGTRSILGSLVPELEGSLEVLTNDVNRGHGPTLITAYEHALRSDPDYVLQVDGDGQFHGSDLRRVLVLLLDETHAVSGVRRFRVDPWFRMAMSRLVREYVRWSFSVSARDPNCPLRGYEAPLLRELLGMLPEACLVPNLYLTILACRRGLPLLEVDVSHRVRRGTSAQGTTWGGGGHSPIPMRLVRFSLGALMESRRLQPLIDAADPGHRPASRPDVHERVDGAQRRLQDPDRRRRSLRARLRSGARTPGSSGLADTRTRRASRRAGELRRRPGGVHVGSWRPRGVQSLRGVRRAAR